MNWTYSKFAILKEYLLVVFLTTNARNVLDKITQFSTYTQNFFAGRMKSFGGSYVWHPWCSYIQLLTYFNSNSTCAWAIQRLFACIFNFIFVIWFKINDQLISLTQLVKYNEFKWSLILRKFNLTWIVTWLVTWLDLTRVTSKKRVTWLDSSHLWKSIDLTWLESKSAMTRDDSWLEGSDLIPTLIITLI